MGDELPSFSVARLRRRAAEHRRLDYNAPLLSVRRAAADAGGAGRSLWKLSAELKSEPIQAAGAVPFEWELHPGRPKQQPPAPSSPRTPSTAASPRSATPSTSLAIHPSPPSLSATVQSVSSSSSPPPSSSASSSPFSSSLHSSNFAPFSGLQLHPPLPRTSPPSSPPFHVPPPPALLQCEQHDQLLRPELLLQPHLDECQLECKPYNGSSAAAQGKEEEDEKLEAVPTNCRPSLDEGQNGCFMDAFPPTSHQAAVAKPSDHRAAVASPGNGDHINSPGRLPLVKTHPNFSSKTQDVSARRGYTARKIGLFNPLRFISVGLRTAFAHACRRALASVGSLSRINCPVNAVAHRDDSSTDSDEEEFVVREVKANLQGRRNQKIEHTSNLGRNTSFTVNSLRYATNTDGSSRFSISPKGSPLHDQARKSLSAIPVHDQAEAEGDEPQFYDAPSRFGSQTTTPGRISHRSGESMSLFDEGFPRDSISDRPIFGDGASSRFETPRASVIDVCKIVETDSGLMREGSRSPTSTDPKSSNLSQRVGKALRLDTREKQAGMKETNGASRHFSGEQGLPTYSSLGKPREQQLELRNGSFSRWRRHRSMDIGSYKGSLYPGSISAIFPAKCGTLRDGRSEEVTPAEEIGWPLGISSYCSDPQMSSLGALQKDAQNNIPGASVPSPPLPPSPSGSSWLHKALSSRALKPSPLAALREAKAGSTKKKLEFSLSEAAAGAIGWEDMVKKSHVQLGHDKVF